MVEGLLRGEPVHNRPSQADVLTAGCSPALRWRLDGGAGRSPVLSAERENCLAEEAARSKALVAQAGNCHPPLSLHLQ